MPSTNQILFSFSSDKDCLRLEFARPWVRFPAGLCCVFSSDPAVSSSIFVEAEREENLIRNDPDKSEFTFDMPCRTRQDVGDRTGSGRCMRSIEQSRVASLTNLQLQLHRDASANCCVFARAQFDAAIGRSGDLGSHFVIRARHARFFLVDFLANERELTGKTFTTPLTSPNPNIKYKIHFPVEVRFNINEPFTLGSTGIAHSACGLGFFLSSS